MAFPLTKQSDFPSELKGHPGIGMFVGRELRNLADIIGDNENVFDVISGQYGNKNGLLVATNSRLFFFVKGMLSAKVEDFPLDKVSSIQYETGMVFGSITVFASGNKAEIKSTLKAHTKAFADGVRERMTKPAAASSTLASPGGVDITAELQKLATLKANGLLTDEEFAAAKKKALGL